MPSTDAHRPLDVSAPPHPAELLARWPKDEPLAALVSGGELGTHNGWSIFARPRETVVIPASASAEEARSILASALARTPRLDSANVARRGQAQSDALNDESHTRTSPFDGGWIVALGYGLGSVFEPAAPARLPRDAPLAVLHWCLDAWIFDHASGALTAVGSPPKLAEPGLKLAEPGLKLAEPGPNAPSSAPSSPAPSSPSDRAWELSSLSCEPNDAGFAAKVARTVEYIRAGDAFQANIARRFSAEFRGCPRTFAHAAIRANNAWFGAAIDLPNGGALVSMSPESFLRVYPDGAIVTRPIKGTRPTSTDPRELLESDKDAAELAMIVDLMRNDLGRVAEIGSVEVTTARVLETHVTVHHGVAEVRARLAPQVDWLELLAATFPPGSVTGAPKVRAMQIIDELEPTPRGFYCGAMGFIARSGHAALNVAIRTAQLGAASADGVRTVAYHAGCGIVVESSPADEVAETHAKTRALARLVAPAEHNEPTKLNQPAKTNQFEAPAPRERGSTTSARPISGR
ncbi:MAG: Aminodeoxychorismate synthase component 1 [Planctomycetota bacterium]